MLNNGIISSRQLIILFLIFSMGDSVLILPSIVTGEAEQDAWISGIVSVIAGFFIVSLFYKVGKMYPELTLVEYTTKLLGKWVGGCIAVLFIFYGLLSVGALLREIGDFMTSLILVETPISAILILMIIVVAFAIRLGLEPIARSAEIFFPWMILLFVFLMLFLIPEMKPDNLKPVFEDGIKPILRGSITFTAYPFIEMFMILMFLPFVKKKNEIRKSLLIGGGLAGIILISLTLMSVLVLGWEMTSTQSYSGYKLATKISAGDIIERVEAVLAGIWFITIFFKMVLYFYASCLGTSQLFNFKDFKFLVIPMSLFAVTIALIMTENSMYLGNIFVQQWPFYDFVHGIIFLIIIWIAGTIKMKKA